MEKDFHRMELDLGHVEDRESFSFKEEFTLPSHDGGENECRATVLAEVTRAGSRYLLEVKVECDLRADCSRCMNLFDYKVNTDLKIVFQRGEKVELPDGEDESDFVFLLQADTFSYDIFPRVREAILLELPIKYLCRVDCAGICVSCGADLNSGECGCGKNEGDPRWAVLNSLKEETENRKDPQMREE